MGLGVGAATRATRESRDQCIALEKPPVTSSRGRARADARARHRVSRAWVPIKNRGTARVYAPNDVRGDGRDQHYYLARRPWFPRSQSSRARDVPLCAWATAVDLRRRIRRCSCRSSCRCRGIVTTRSEPVEGDFVSGFLESDLYSILASEKKERGRARRASSARTRAGRRASWDTSLRANRIVSRAASRRA